MRAANPLESFTREDEQNENIPVQSEQPPADIEMLVQIEQPPAVEMPVYVRSEQPPLYMTPIPIERPSYAIPPTPPVPPFEMS